MTQARQFFQTKRACLINVSVVINLEDSENLTEIFLGPYSSWVDLCGNLRGHRCNWHMGTADHIWSGRLRSQYIRERHDTAEDSEEGSWLKKDSLGASIAQSDWRTFLEWQKSHYFFTLAPSVTNSESSCMEDTNRWTFSHYSTRLHEVGSEGTAARLPNQDAERRVKICWAYVMNVLRWQDAGFYVCPSVRSLTTTTDLTDTGWCKLRHQLMTGLFFEANWYKH